MKMKKLSKTYSKQSIMKQYLILAASAALILASCAKIETTAPSGNDERVDFGVYVPRVVKAGSAGEMNQTKLQTTGFGVMAYVKAGNYDGSKKPNFMYNQFVEYSGSAWTYSPIKYWPNQLNDDGTTDGQGAWSQEAQTVSFFAYAPYVTEATGTSGIVGMSAASATGDPTITYAISTALDENVDLVWGVADNITWNNVAGGTNAVTEGLPYLNLQKPAIGTKVKFKFYHALAQLNLTAVGSFNSSGIGGTAKNGVKVTIEEVELTVPDMRDEAVLNLNNTEAKKPKWNFTASQDTTLTLVARGDSLHTDVLDAGACKAADQPTGVTSSEGPVLAENKYYTLIPTDDTSVEVTVKITYYVTTDDDNLDDKYSRVKNVIRKKITFDHGFAAGKKYSIKMILGLSEVALEGTVADWENGTVEQVYLPKNVE